MIYHIKDFIGEEGNITSAIVKATMDLSDGDTLCLDGGRFEISPDGAYIATYYMSNNDGGVKPIVFPLINKKNVTIDGGGATLVFTGEVLPFVVDRCDGVVLKGFSIDYTVSRYAQAEIVVAEEDRIVLKFDGKQFFCRVDEEGKWCFYNPEGWECHRSSAYSRSFDATTGGPVPYSKSYVPYCDAKKNGVTDGFNIDVHLVQLEDNLIEVRGDFGGCGTNHKVGEYLIQSCAGREFPGIFVCDSRDIEISDVTLYQTIAMGIIAQTTENIKLHKVIATPRRDLGRILSTGADSTHFVNCRGKIEISHCKFVHMMDDAVNIHGNYHRYLKKDEDGSLLLSFGHHQQKGVQIYALGDTVHVIDSVTNEIKTEARVVSAELVDIDTIKLKLDAEVEMPTNEHWVTENISTAPEVHIHHTESGYNRPRGFLLSTRGKVLVEKCKFYNMIQGIQLSGELCYWYESGAALDVTIRDNDFDNSAYAGGVAILSCPVLRATQTNKDIIYSGRLLIENNRFVQSEKRIMKVAHAAHVIFRNNTFKKDDSLPYHAPNGENGITFEHCGKVEIDDVIDI